MVANQIEFNYGDNDTWYAGVEVEAGRWVGQHTVPDQGEYTITARDMFGAYDSTTVVVEPLPPGALAITDVQPNPGPFAQDQEYTVTGAGFVTDNVQSFKIKVTNTADFVSYLYAYNPVIIDDNNATFSLRAADFTAVKPGDGLVQTMGNTSPGVTFAMQFA